MKGLKRRMSPTMSGVLAAVAVSALIVAGPTAAAYAADEVPPSDQVAVEATADTNTDVADQPAADEPAEAAPAAPAAPAVEETTPDPVTTEPAPEAAPAPGPEDTQTETTSDDTVDSAPAEDAESPQAEEESSQEDVSTPAEEEADATPTATVAWQVSCVDGSPVGTASITVTGVPEGAWDIGIYDALEYQPLQADKPIVRDISDGVYTFTGPVPVGETLYFVDSNDFIVGESTVKAEECAVVPEEPKYRLTLWKVSDSDGNGDYWEQKTPNDGSWSLKTNSNSLSQLDHLATQCGKYQADLYWNSETTDALIAGGVLYGPNNPKEDLAYGETSGDPYKTFKVTDCDITVPERVPTFLDVCGIDEDEVMVPADGENFRFVTNDNRVNGVGLVTVDLVANEGYTIPKGVTTHWEHKFTNEPCPVEVDVPAMPDYVDECGPGNIHWTLLGQEGVVATFNDDGSVTFTPEEGYVFKGEEQSKTYSLPEDSNELCVVEIKVPGMPGVTDLCGPDNVRWTEVPASTDKVEWTENADGSLTATAKDGYVFPDGKQSVTFTLPADSNVACAVPAGNTDKTLAMTGGPSVVNFAVAAGILVPLGIFLMTRRRRVQA